MTKIHPSAVVEKDVQLGQDVVIGPNCVIKSGVTIGDGTILEANVVIEKGVKIGRENWFYPNCVVGARPQMLSLSRDQEIGGLIIGDRNVFHEQVTVHPSIHPGGHTKLGDENFLMVGSHLGHDTLIGNRIVISNCVQISGHCHIEDGVWLSGLVGAHQFVTIGKWAYVAGLAGVNKDIPPFLTVSGHYPPRVRGVNKRGLVRAGYSEQQQQRIMSAYRRLYRQGGALLENARVLAQEDGLDENVLAMIEAITRSSQQRYGRYLELSRHR